MKTDSIVKEVVINAPTDRVWKALTTNAEMKHWYFDLEAFEPVVGFEFSFYGGSKEKQYLHLCKVTNVVEGKKISYTWRYDGYEGNSEVSFELFDEAGKTKLVLTHMGVSSFENGTKDFAPESFNAGWEYIIGTSIKKYIEHETA